MITSKPFAPAPPDFPFVFVKDGWRGVERFFGGRTERNRRWIKECGRDRLNDLRRRYMRGEVAVLDEARRVLSNDEKMSILSARKAEAKDRLVRIEAEMGRTVSKADEVKV